MDHIGAVRRRSSLFSSTPVSGSVSTSSEQLKYEKQLRLEIKQWNDLLRAKYRDLQQMRAASAVVDQSVLTEEQKRYLADGPTVESYLAETEAFDNALTAYIERKSFLLQRNAHIVHEAKVLVELKLKDSIANDLLANDFLNS
uniref:Uncharacterized protein n=1 Tax=Anopheles atroparvus TaxID=41427 RepID=A0A182IJ24_ANOAO